MSFFRQIGKFLSGGPAPTISFYPVTVRCNKCKEILETRVNLANDLSVEYDDKGEISGFVCRKLLQGSGMCFQAIEVNMRFNPNRIISDCQVVGGTLVE